MSNPQDILQKIQLLLTEKKLNKQAEAELEEGVLELCTTEEGLPLLGELLKDHVDKKVLGESIIQGVQLRLEKTPPGEGASLPQIEQNLLVKLAEGQKIDRPTKWKAVKILSEYKGTKRVLSRALSCVPSTKSKAIERYNRFVRPHLEPDGGLAILQSLWEFGASNEWMRSVIAHLRKEEPAAGADSQESARTGGVLQGEKIEGQVAPQLSESIGPSVPASSADDFIFWLEKGVRQIKDIANDRERLKSKTKDWEERFATLQNIYRQQTNEVEGIRQKLHETETTLEKNQAEHQAAIAEIERLKKTLEEVEGRASQDIDRISEEKTSVLKTAHYELWQRIKPNFIEVMDSRVDLNSLPPEQRVLYRKVKSIFDALCSLGIVPQDERR
jgi:hypothetical protein